MQIKHALLASCAVTLAGCGPKFSAPNAPTTACRAVSKAQYDAAIATGAAQAKAKITSSGGFDMITGAGVKHCSAFTGSKQICRRPNDFVIKYTLPNEQVKYVMVPKNREYRLTIQRKPIPCEVIDS